MAFSHIPVLLEKTITALNIKPDGLYVDGTVGGAGHSREIAKRLKGGRLYCIDQDPDALKVAVQRLKEFQNVTVIEGNFSDIDQILENAGVRGADGILFDIGVSSYQLDHGQRGFSFHHDAPLDMRMSQKGPTAADLVNKLTSEELIKILYDYGEEKFAKRIADKIEKARSDSPIHTTGRLAEIIKSAYPSFAKRDGHPARKSFQALRIAVNSELDCLGKGIDSAAKCLNVSGRLAVITFHSLEDRIVKRKFEELCRGCTCPPEFPVCVCNKAPYAKNVCKKPLVADESELAVNNRSRSAKLRVIERI